MKNVLLYGDSIFLSGLTAQLQNMPDVTVRQQAPRTGPLSLGGLDAVIVDLNAVESADILPILCTRPDLQVIGVNAAGGIVMILSAKVYLARTLVDVVACME